MATDDVTNLDAAHVPDKTAVDAIAGQWKFDKPVATPGGENFMASGELEVWSAGASSAPDGFTLVGAGASVAQEAAAANVKQGSFSALLTRAGTDCYLSQNILTKAGPVGLWQSKTVVLGAWVKCAAASRARIGIFDGTTTTFSAYHSGGGAFEWLTVSVALGAGITALEARLQIDTGNTTAYFDAVVFTLGSGIPEWMPSAFVAAGGGAGATGTGKASFRGLRVFSDPDEPTQRMRVIVQEAVLVDANGNAKKFSNVNVMADIGSAGANGLDTGGVAASTEYDLHVIAKEDSTLGATFHKGLQWSKDQDFADTSDAALGLRDAAGRTQLAQGFKVSAAGVAHSFQLRIRRVGSPTGFLWLEVQSDAAGVPSNTKVTGGRSILIPIDDLDPTTPVTMRLWLPERPALTAGTQYHLVVKGDWTVSGANYVEVRVDASSPSYSNGSVSTADGSSVWTADATRDFSPFVVNILTGAETIDAAVTATYPYSGRVSWNKTDGSGNLIKVRQRGARWEHGIKRDTGAITGGGTLWTPTDLSAFMPAAWVETYHYVIMPNVSAASIMADPLPIGSPLTATNFKPYSIGQSSSLVMVPADLDGQIGPMVWTTGDVANVARVFSRGFTLML